MHTNHIINDYFTCKSIHIFTSLYSHNSTDLESSLMLVVAYLVHDILSNLFNDLHAGGFCRSVFFRFNS
jgi:hypothetical protein